MHPLLIGFLPSYGLMAATALLVAWIWFIRGAERDGLDPHEAGRIAFWTVVGGLLGAKLGLVIVDFGWYAGDLGRLLSIDFLRAAGVIWAGVLSGLVTLAVLAWRAELPLGRLLDAVAVPLPVSQAIGRIGCLLAGCCYGSSCALPWAVTYHSAEAHDQQGVPLGVGLHPTPLYEAAWNVLVVLPAVMLVRARRQRPGEAALAYLVLYGSGRFVVELFRGDAVRGLWFGGLLSTSQLISLVVAPAAAVAWLSLRLRQRASQPSTSRPDGKSDAASDAAADSTPPASEPWEHPKNA
ncbi:MAG: prolipoprotein diacylglyceryl transferase [Acidobacteriota bacterium]|nr:MAG: prolipoprotein diacylglyceryl transferase [Acidobacteriota bacterium]